MKQILLLLTKHSTLADLAVGIGEEEGVASEDWLHGFQADVIHIHIQTTIHIQHKEFKEVVALLG